MLIPRKRQLLIPSSGHGMPKLCYQRPNNPLLITLIGRIDFVVCLFVCLFVVCLSAYRLENVVNYYLIISLVLMVLDPPLNFLADYTSLLKWDPPYSPH